MQVTVTAEDLDTARNEGSVLLVTGTTEDGTRVRFAGDHRPMAGFLAVVEDEGEATAEVESWQVLG